MLCFQDLDRGAILVHAAALGPFFVLAGISGDCNHMYTQSCNKRRKRRGGVNNLFSFD